MRRLDFSTSTYDEINELLYKPGLPDATIIKALEWLANEGYINYISDFVRREGLSEAVLVKGAELLANTEESRPDPIAHVLDNNGLSEEARDTVRASLVHSISSMDDMVYLTFAMGIHRLLTEFASEEVKLAVIEGLGEQGCEFAKQELREVIKKNKRYSPLRMAAEKALGEEPEMDDAFLEKMERAVRRSHYAGVHMLLRQEGVRPGDMKKALAMVMEFDPDEVLSLLADDVSDERKLECARLLGEGGKVRWLAGQLGEWQRDSVKGKIEDALIRAIEVVSDDDDWARGNDRMEELRDLTSYGREPTSRLDPSASRKEFHNVYGVSDKVQEAAKAAIIKIESARNPLAGDGVQSPRSKDLLAPPKRTRNFIAERLVALTARTRRR